jgi:hypothetical protein
MTEAIGESDFSAESQAAIQLDEVALICCANDGIVVRELTRPIQIEDCRAPDVSRCGSATKYEYRLLEDWLL